MRGPGSTKKLLFIVALFFIIEPSLLLYAGDLSEPAKVSLYSRYGMGDEQRILKTTTRDYREAFQYLKSQNPGIKHLQIFRPDSRRRFVEAFSETQDSLFFKTDSGEVCFLANDTIHRWRGFEPLFVGSTNRRPGYLKDEFTTADALSLRGDESLHFMITERAPEFSSIESELADRGLAPQDFFFLWFLPERFDSAAGYKIPLIPYAISKKYLSESGIRFEDLDFSRMKIVLPGEALSLRNRLIQEAANSDERQSARELLHQSGVHIPVKSAESSEEFFIPMTALQVFYQDALTSYLYDLLRNDPRRFEEGRNRQNSSTAEVAERSFKLLQLAGTENPAQAAMLDSLVQQPSYIPEERRARDRQLETSDLPTQIHRASTTLFTAMLGRLTHSRARQEQNFSSKVNSDEVVPVIEDFLEFSLEETGSFSMYRIQEMPERLNEFPDQFEILSNRTAEKSSKWKARLGIGALSLAPILFFSPQLVSLFSEEAGRILNQWTIASGLTLIAYGGAKALLYFRNLSIRDAQALQLKKERDVSDDIEEESLYEHERLSNQIAETRNPIKKIWLRTKRAAVMARYSSHTNSDEKMEEILSKRVSRITENGALPAAVLDFKQWIYSKMGWIYTSLRPSLLIQMGVGSIFPRYQSTRALGGRASIRSLSDWGMLPRGAVAGRRAWGRLRALADKNYDDAKAWQEFQERRVQSISAYALAEPAIGIALKDLQTSYALDIGFTPQLIVSILSVERKLNEHGHRWMARVLKNLPEHEPIDSEKLIRLDHYIRELENLAGQNNLTELVIQKAKKDYLEAENSESLRHEEKLELLSRFAKRLVERRIESRKERYGDNYFSRPSFLVTSTLNSMVYDSKITFHRWGASGENLVTREILNPGEHGPMQLLDRIPVTTQAGIVTLTGVTAGGSDLVFLNGMTPFWMTVVAGNLVGASEGIVANSKTIDTILEGRVQDPETSFGNSLKANFLSLPWRAINYHSGPKFSQRIPASVTMSLITLGALIPLNLLSPSEGIDFTQTLQILGTASLVSGAASLIFSAFSVPYYIAGQAWRVATGYVGGKSRVLFTGLQLPLNIAYGLAIAGAVQAFAPSIQNNFDDLQNLTAAPAISEVETSLLESVQRAPELEGEPLEAEANQAEFYHQVEPAIFEPSTEKGFLPEPTPQKLSANCRKDLSEI